MKKPIQKCMIFYFFSTVFKMYASVKKKFCDTIKSLVKNDKITTSEKLCFLQDILRKQPNMIFVFAISFWIEWNKYSIPENRAHLISRLWSIMDWAFHQGLWKSHQQCEKIYQLHYFSNYSINCKYSCIRRNVI
jgi:hypothetical protein